MKQILQNLKDGITEVSEIPAPQVLPGSLLIKTKASIISAGTERMLVDFGKANLLAKAKQQKASASERSWEQLGLRLAPAVSSTVQQLQPRYHGGLLVQEVRFGSPASDKGIRPGDILVGLHIWETVKPDNFSITDASNIFPFLKFNQLRAIPLSFGCKPSSSAVFILYLLSYSYYTL